MLASTVEGESYWHAFKRFFASDLEGVPVWPRAIGRFVKKYGPQFSPTPGAGSPPHQAAGGAGSAREWQRGYKDELGTVIDEVRTRISTVTDLVGESNPGLSPSRVADRVAAFLVRDEAGQTVLETLVELVVVAELRLFEPLAALEGRRTAPATSMEWYIQLFLGAHFADNLA
jgi:hypothetical protein